MFVISFKAVPMKPKIYLNIMEQKLKCKFEINRMIEFNNRVMNNNIIGFTVVNHIYLIIII